MSGLSRQQARLLAVLLDADGALVPYAALGDVLGSSGVNDASVCRLYVWRLRAKGVGCVAVVNGLGLRMTQLPPDWTLETVLWALDALRRDDEIPVLVWRWAS